MRSTATLRVPSSVERMILHYGVALHRPPAPAELVSAERMILH